MELEQLETYTLAEHFLELKRRFLYVVFWFFFCAGISYLFSQRLYEFLLIPLLKTIEGKTHKIIYTNLTEAFFTHLRLAIYTGIFLTIPIISIQIYRFVSTGLYKSEKKLMKYLAIFSILLFYFGNIFAFTVVLPKAWKFFLSFESNNISTIPIVLEAKISEYLSLVVNFGLAFGLAFQLPVVLIGLNILKILSINTLVEKRRIAVITNFIIAGFITPPDVFSQVVLAIPMILLYETSIIICKMLKKGAEC